MMGIKRGRDRTKKLGKGDAPTIYQEHDFRYIEGYERRGLV